jgi:mediator of RNA polymerase II transcription subunit 5
LLQKARLMYFSPGARKALSQSLASFIPSIMQNASQIAARLELFRTETLAGFEPVDKKKEAANAEMDELLDETLGLQNLSIPDLHVDRSRAGLYIYLNAAVGSSAMQVNSPAADTPD